MSRTTRRPKRDQRERPFPYVPRAVPVTARRDDRIPTRQSDAWQHAADLAQVGWTTH
jgi:hypothetical protein